ncbi:low molecular weight protein-tyrosine-phosphatase [Aliarcobacter lanthieri]|uniref:low molecular weight protein-tyrosine-phosphatase n=1 Tax=Aliarcobacter lanthieri TaxID=1355374 RepID=UPI00192379DB|nr:low molecular weight protein-tyrosine-phosphatase [Aliarcobacter lanthieri]MBL3520708.1 low molecular weight phosphotyrosine protein phosphatase [Aliarcobacter lanthieri]
MSKSILFVCLGNICRSPLAHGIAQEYINKKYLDIVVDSAGTGSWHIGEAPCENSIKVAYLNGVDISKQRARQIQKEDFKNFDLIVALDDNNLRDLKNLGYVNPLKLGDYGYEGACVPDPYYFKDFEDFKNVYSMIEKCVINLIKKTI